MDPRLFLKLAPQRQLKMTHALHQALGILQMTQLELKEWLTEVIEKNPLLKLHFSSPKKNIEYEVPYQPSLYEHLQSQIQESFSCKEKRRAAEFFLEHLDEKGFLSDLPEAWDKEILSVLQTFDPPGIFARNLQEALLIQLKNRGKENTVSFTLIQHHFDDLLQNRFSKIKKSLQVSDLSSIFQELAHLSFRPSEAFKKEPTTPIYADLRLEKSPTGWTLELMEDDLPKIHLESEYLSIEGISSEEKETLKGFKAEANWLCRILERRRKFIRLVGKILAHKQMAFFNQKGPLVCITMKELAEKLQVHESTLSRALSNKYISTPRGIIPLRSLIVNDPAIETAKELLKQLVQNEDKRRPLTDEDLAQSLKAKGLSVARRTIAKYRTQLKIGSANQRKLSC
jgi:RNA polymerase sigma-54 factor